MIAASLHFPVVTEERVPESFCWIGQDVQQLCPHAPPRTMPGRSDQPRLYQYVGDGDLLSLGFQRLSAFQSHFQVTIWNSSAGFSPSGVERSQRV